MRRSLLLRTAIARRVSVAKRIATTSTPGIGDDLIHMIQTQADLTHVVKRLQEGDWKALGEA